MVSVPTVEAQVFLPCKTTKDCEYLHCSSGTGQCIKSQCQCSGSLTRKHKIDNLKPTKYAQTCKVTSDCDPSMKPSCVSGSAEADDTFGSLQIVNHLNAHHICSCN
ncbi:unnamed protein product [Eruca vesicaria subsp. sativa]|uniref:EB domain-containing protein n=1 Tax=Eruca vesicaria subsp. sativa TaxID=29727 RepID=A0ABC8LSY7_ERUVS|nr:unnamed protein product [Eruca vesicaria subsp. sativa]